MRSRLIMIIVVAVTICNATNVFAKEDYALAMVFASLVDYDTIYARIFERCTILFPETKEPLRSSIAKWSEQNRPVLREIRAILRENMIREGSSEKYADAQMAKIAESSTKTMLDTLTNTSKPELEKNCHE